MKILTILFSIYLLMIQTQQVILNASKSAKKDRKLFLRWDREEKWKRHIDAERCKLKSQRGACKKNAGNDQNA